MTAGWRLEWQEGGVCRSAALRGPLRIGRALDNDIVLDDPAVSRHHCTVRVGSDGRVVVDARESTNAITVGGRQVEGARLDGGEFRVGGVAFRVVQARAGDPHGDHRPAGSRSRTGSRRGTAVAAVAAGVIGVAALGGVLAAVLTSGGGSHGSAPLADHVAEALNSGNASTLLAALGDPNPDPQIRDAVQQALGAHPGLRVELESSQVTRTEGDIRVESRTYRISEPGQVDRHLTVDVASRQTGGQWVTVSTIPREETTG